MTIRLAIDQIEDYYELLSFQLEDLCQEAFAGQSWTSPLANTPLLN
jgi:hypothetical protein